MRTIRRILLIALTLGALTLPATSADAAECLGVRGVLCIHPGRQCITTPCYINP